MASKRSKERVELEERVEKLEQLLETLTTETLKEDLKSSPNDFPNPRVSRGAFKPRIGYTNDRSNLPPLDAPKDFGEFDTLNITAQDFKPGDHVRHDSNGRVYLSEVEKSNPSRSGRYVIVRFTDGEEKSFSKDAAYLTYRLKAPEVEALYIPAKEIKYQDLVELEGEFRSLMVLGASYGIVDNEGSRGLKRINIRLRGQAHGVELNPEGYFKVLRNVKDAVRTSRLTVSAGNVLCGDLLRSDIIGGEIVEKTIEPSKNWSVECNIHDCRMKLLNGSELVVDTDKDLPIERSALRFSQSELNELFLKHHVSEEVEETPSSCPIHTDGFLHFLIRAETVREDDYLILNDVPHPIVMSEILSTTLRRPYSVDSYVDERTVVKIYLRTAVRTYKPDDLIAVHRHE